MLIINNPRIINRKYDFAFREIASGEDAEAMNF